MSDTSPRSNIISKKLSCCSNRCTLLVFRQTAIRKHRQVRIFLLSLRSSCNQKKMLMVARAIPNLELQISYFQGWHGTDIPCPIGLIVSMHASNHSKLAGKPFGQGQPTPLGPQIMS